MALSKNIQSFHHIKTILDAALPHEYIEYRLPDAKAATRWRMEAYHFRRLAQAEGTIKYDQLFLQLSGEVVKISKRKVEGVLTLGPKGVPPKEEPLPEETEDFAFNLAKSLGLNTGEDDDNSN